jgi:acyl dehydratase
MKRHVFENIEKGEVFGPLPLKLDDHLVRGFAFAVDDFSARYFRTAQDCGPMVAPALLAKKLLHIFMSKYDPQGVSAVHLKDDIEFHAPARFGDEITLSACYSDVFVRKGRTSVVLDGEARDSAGTLLLRHRSIEIVPAEGTHPESEQADPTGLAQRRVDTTWPENAAVAESAATARAGMVLPSRCRTIHQDQMSVFVGANEGWRNIHTDIDIARAAGFERTIMSGMIQACWFTHLMTDFFGDAFLSGGRLGITFLRNVASEETIRLQAVVRSIRDDGTLEIEFWSTNADGEATAVGWATGKA